MMSFRMAVCYDKKVFTEGNAFTVQVKGESNEKKDSRGYGDKS